MKKLLLGLLLIIASTTAMAEWIVLGESNGITTYINLASIRKEGDIAKMWSLDDYKTSQDNGDGYKYFSGKSFNEYDCKKEKKRGMTLVNYSDNMGKGDVVYSQDYDNRPWHSIVPDTFGEGLWKAACGKQ